MGGTVVWSEYFVRAEQSGDVWWWIIIQYRTDTDTGTNTMI